ncbi:MAG: PilZ domain-containing protein [Bryobacteraceae bacterium]|jgi:hypothetical protein
MQDHDQRTESRVRSQGQVNLLAAGGDVVSGTIHDVSPSGISVVAESEISVGTPVQIDGDGFTGHGVVRYCRRHGQSYRLGVAVGPAAAV